MRTWPALTLVSPTQTDLILAELLDHDVAAVEELADAWRVFFPTSAARERAYATLRGAFPDLTVEPIDVPDEDWAARTQASLRAIQIGRIIVAPPWDRPTNVEADLQVGLQTGDSGPITIVIQPSMGFGTGHHATTRLCLASLQALDLRGLGVLDVGTGSGVLAIAASRLGAGPVRAIDDDADAVQSALDNVALNPGAHVTVDVADLRSVHSAPADVLVANLTGGLLTASAPRLLDLTAAEGRLILSGFMEHEERDVLGSFSGCAMERRLQEDEWLCVTLRRAS